MKQLLFIFITLFATIHSYGQATQDPLGDNVAIYYSTQKKDFTTYQGELKYTTKNYESGDFKLKTEGPILIKVNPEPITIAPNTTNKKFTGELTPDGANLQEGNSYDAKIIAEGHIQFNRAKGEDEEPGDIVVSEHKCSGCDKHKGVKGDHQVVKRPMTGEQNLKVHAIKVDITGDELTGKGSTIELTANEFPVGVGKYKWEVLNGDIKIDGADDQKTVKVTSKADGGAFGEVQVTLTVDGDKGSKATFTHKKEVIFFDLGVNLDKKKICDGDKITVTLTPLPQHQKVTPAAVQACLNNLEVKSRRDPDKPGFNLKNKTDIIFNLADLKATSDQVYWYTIAQNNPCNVSANYAIFAEADCKCAKGEKLKTKEELLEVHTEFERSFVPGCFGGKWKATSKKMDWHLRQYTLTNTVRQGNTTTFEFTPAPGFPNMKVIAIQGTQKVSYQAEFDARNVPLLIDFEQFNLTSGESQFYPVVEAERKILKNMLEKHPNTGVAPLDRLLNPIKIFEVANPDGPTIDPDWPQHTLANLDEYLERIWRVRVYPEMKRAYDAFESANWDFIYSEVRKKSEAELKLQFQQLYRCDSKCVNSW